MLGKLMKYDIKKMSKVIILFYVVSIFLAGLTRLINIGKEIQVVAIFGYIFGGLTYSAIGSILVNTFVHIIRIFRIDFYKDESYLTHTLPVKKEKLLLSKYLSSLIVILNSVLVCFFSLFILFYSPSFMHGLKMFISATVSGFNMSSWLFITLVILIIFAQICSMISMSFAAIIKANIYNHKRIPKGIMWFVLFYISSLISVVVIGVLTLAIQGNVSQLVATKMNNISFITILIVGLMVYVLYALLFYFISKFLFKKGVNVD